MRGFTCTEACAQRKARALHRRPPWWPEPSQSLLLAGVNIDQLLSDMPPAMSSTISEILYHRFLSAMPLFRGLSSEVIAGLCHEVRPLIALKGQVIIKAGSTGREMYMVMTGEVEVLSVRHVLSL